MKQIIEDYCSFEIAQLLKEKEFVGESEIGCRCGFYKQNEEYPSQINLVYDDLDNSKLEYNECLRFTHQMALKWLREVHNIFIDIITYTTGSKIQFRWVGYDKGRLFSQEKGKIIYFDTHEQTVEAALKYTLENLI